MTILPPTVPSLRRAVFAAVLLLAAMAALSTASSSRAAETIYWNNYSDDPDSIGFANPDGSGGGALNLTGAALSGPEGMAYDTVTNRLFVANVGSNQIVAINLDGSGAAVFAAPGAPVVSPSGLVVDPETRTVYWINTEVETISWARIDGTVGGVVDTGGVAVNAYRLALDPVAKRLYWFDEDASPGVVRYAGLTAPGSGVVNIAGASPTNSASGIAVEPTLGKVFWLNDGEGFISWASLSGAGGGNIPTLAGSFNGAYGVAVDAALGRAYWANYSNGEGRAGALGFANLAGGGGPINVATAPIAGPQDPIVIKPPTATAAPVIARGAGAARSQLSCSTGSWAADAAGAFVYQSPRAYAYQWTLGGAPIGGAVGTTLTATQPGAYACAVTATNQAGAVSQTSAATVIKSAKAKLTVKKKVTVKAGKPAVFKLTIANQGDLKSKNAKVCATIPKSAKDELKAPKCKSLGKLNTTGKRKATLRIKTLPEASGTYKVSFKVKGSTGKPAKSKIQVIG